MKKKVVILTAKLRQRTYAAIYVRWLIREISFPALGWLHEDTTAAYVSHRVRRPRAVGMSCLSEALANSQCLLPPRADVRLVTRVPRKQSYTRERA